MKGSGYTDNINDHDVLISNVGAEITISGINYECDELSDFVKYMLEEAIRYELGTLLQSSPRYNGARGYAHFRRLVSCCF